MRWLARDLGNAGAYGFSNNNSSTHTLLTPTANCSLCNTHPVRVHNVPLREFEHSDQFLSPKHARELWLPFLWGFSPDELYAYVKDCKQATSLQAEKRWNEAGEIVERLWRSRFSWTGGKTLDQFVRELVEASIAWGPPLRSNPSVTQIVRGVRFLLHASTADADSESVREGEVDADVVRALNPNVAMAKVVTKSYQNTHEVRITAVDPLTAIIGRLATAARDEDAWRSLYRQLWPFVVAVAYCRLKAKVHPKMPRKKVFDS